MAPADDARLSRERDFHDARFTDNRERAATRKYYEVDTGKAAYRDAIVSRARGADALEYGCGPGSTSIGLARRGALVTAIDISTAAVARARRKAERNGLPLRLEVMDAHRLAFPDDSFDLVCGSGILHHLDLATALPEVARVLRPDGTAVFYEPLGTNPLINLYRRLTPSMRTSDEHPLVSADFALMRRSFASVGREEHTFVALLAPVLDRLGVARRFVPRLHGADRWLFRRFPWTRRLAWVTVLRLESPRRA